MPREKLVVEKDEMLEKHCNLLIETCSAYLNNDGSVKVMGEARSLQGVPIKEYRTIQVTVYDTDGDIMGRDYTNWIEFGIRQSFEFEFDDLDSSWRPSRIKVFPTAE